MDVILNVKYEAQVTVTGGRSGRATSADGLLDLTLGRPGSGSGTNPEQLLAAAWGACLLGTMQALARKRDVDASDVSLDVSVSLGSTSSESSALGARFVASSALLEQDVVEDLLRSAHRRCPYSRATAGNISVQLETAATAVTASD